MSGRLALDLATFANEPLLEFRRPDVRESALAALADLDRRGPIEVPLLLATGEPNSSITFPSVDPCDPDRVIAVATSADAAIADRALTEAETGHTAWSSVTPADRARRLRGAAELLRSRRLALAALAVREAGKPWVEADADVCEAIDFLEYYALSALELSGERQLAQVPGERNTLRYASRGVCVVISPWNFPFAIACGMVAAGLAAGNAVILKPAPQTPACAYAIVRALHEAGIPRAALQLLPGGDEPGRALVVHRAAHVIAFTGSCAAGLQIVASAAVAAPGQHHVKRVIAEMGGKNCIYVDADADLDDAIPAILSSAFGFAGQKCSAASRVLAHAEIAATLSERLTGAIRRLRVGPAQDFGTDVPAVIDAASRTRLLASLQAAEHPPTVDVEFPEHGFYVPPTLFVDLSAEDPLVCDEQFGPVLAFNTVTSPSEALGIVAASRFALTGGIFSRSPRTIAEFADRAPVGNLYVNREITGAMVGRQPFGGGRFSGTGPKAGGPDYLLQFMEARCVTENTMRHGLVTQV